MRALAIGLGLGVSLLSLPAHAADQIINFSACTATSVERLHELATYVLTRRRYNIEDDTPTMVVGEQDNLRVEILLEPSRMTIRWKEGFGHPKDQWLRSIKTDVLWRFTE